MANRRPPKTTQKVTVPSGRRFILIAGPCVIESAELCREVAQVVRSLARLPGVDVVFKASYDKANRTSGKSFRGPGLDAGLEVLASIRRDFGLPVLTDVHSPEEAIQAGRVVDVLQIPAFLCRQTDLLEAAVSTGKVVNVKKGQFLSPWEMEQVVLKSRGFGGRRLWLTERGTTFGYNNLVADMRSMAILPRFGCPVIFDATHSVQQPGAGGDQSGGKREYAPVLARAAVAAGAGGVFVETHPDPDQALSDGPNMIPLQELTRHVKQWLRIHALVRRGV